MQDKRAEQPEKTGESAAIRRAAISTRHTASCEAAAAAADSDSESGKTRGGSLKNNHTLGNRRAEFSKEDKKKPWISAQISSKNTLTQRWAN